MKKNVFAVCDLEVDYAYHFMNYLNQKKKIPFEVQAFTNVQKLIDFSKGKHIELLLISQKAMCREIKELDVGKLIILSEGDQLPELNQYASVYKYQSSADVIREVMACYGEEKAMIPAQFPVLKKTTEVLGVYSPLGRCLKTSFALAMGQILAREKAVLYLNLESYSGFEQLLRQKFDHNLSDLLYYIRQDNQNLTLRMQSMIRNIGNLDFIPPVQTPEDIRNTGWKDWQRLIQELVLHSSYEIIILDIGQGIEETLQMLEMCNSIFMPVLSDNLSKCKLEQFEKLLRGGDCKEIMDKLIRVKPPYHKGMLSADHYFEQLSWGELGDYVREILDRERK